MYRSIVFLMLTFFLSSGFVNYANFSKKEAAKQQQFLEFLSHFDKVSLPYKLDLPSIDQMDGLSKQNPQMGKILPENDQFFQVAEAFLPSVRRGKFSRVGRSMVYPVARFFPDDETVAVVYKTRRNFDNPLVSNYMLAYFDLKGNLLGMTKKKGFNKNDQQIGFTTLRHTQVFTIFPSGKIETVFYDNQWKAKVGSIALDKNKLLDLKKVKEVDFKLAGPRGIQEITQTNARP